MIDVPPSSATESDQLKCYLDVPAVSQGFANERVRGLFSISGWAIARSGVAEVGVYVDDRFIGPASRGMRRLDIHSAFPDWDGSLLSGFGMMLPRKLFRGEQHTIRIEVKDNSGSVGEIKFNALVDSEGEASSGAALRSRLPQAEINLKVGLSNAAAVKPAFTIGLILDESEPKTMARLEDTLEALRRQAFESWCLLPPCGKE